MSLFKLTNSRASRFLGVDIGHENIKVVEMEVGRAGGQVLHAGMAPTPPHSVLEGQVVMPDLVAQAIRQIVHERGMSARQSIGAVSGSSVFVRPIGVPRQKAADLAQTIVFEAQKWVSTTSEESYFETSMLPEAPDPDPTTEMPILLSVAPRILVDTHVAAMELAGLEPIAMDVHALAAIRALLPPDAFSDTSGPAPTIALVDMGASYTDVTIVQGYIPVFTRTINIGGMSFTNALAGVLGVDFEEAEIVKRRLDAEDTDEASPTASAGRVVNTLLEELIRDVRRSIAYHASTLGWESIEGLVDRLILIGGASRLMHTDDYFANVLQMNVVMGDLPLGGAARISDAAWGEMEDQIPSYLIAIGLGLWPLLNAGGKL
jgi:type IV pilus assembly protein PilM